MTSAAGAATISVPAGGNLQAALDQAQPGDTILLAAGATFKGNYILPAKNGTAVITIRSSAADSSLPAAGQRIAPSYAGLLPKLQSPYAGQAALATAPGASYYTIRFVEFLQNPAGTGALLELGSAASSQNSLSVVPHDLVVDRCYLHSSPGVAQLRGIALNSGKTTIKDSYISEIKYAGQDSQAIAGWNGPGPYTIVNNYLEAAGENFLMGGSSMFIPNTTPTGIEFRNNYLTKQTAWRNSSWTVKNIFELKHAQDVVIDGNVFENNWLAAQPGYAIVFTPRNQYNDNPWTVVQRVTFSNNIVRHVASVFNILGWDNNAPSQQTNHITIRNNVFEDVSAANWGGNGRLLLISEASSVTLDHNTGFQSASAIYAYNTADAGFIFTNNIANATTYGIIGDATGEGNGTINTYFPGSTFAQNVFVACKLPGGYPAQSLFASDYVAVGFVNLAAGDYHLAVTSAYKGKGTDGKDPGADIDALKAALARSTAPGSGPTPPTPPADAAPTVALTSPAGGTAFAAPATTTLSATASDADSTPVARVEFFANGALVGTDTASPYSATWSNVAAGSYSLTAVATDTAGLKTTSAAVAVTVGSTAGVTVLPAPWADSDIGTTGAAGGATYAASGTFTVKGAGADIWGSADAFNYVSQAFAGDGEIVARVTAVQNTNALAKAGIMIRAGVAAGAAHVMLDAKPGGGVEFMARSTANGPTAYLGGKTVTLPVWLKLARVGSTITGSTSTDGTTWAAVGSTTVSMAGASAGLLVSSHVSGTLGTSTFDNVRVQQAVRLTSRDIGSAGLAGSATTANGVVTVKGAGADIWGTADSFQFAYQALAGDGQIVARVASMQNTNAMAKAGVMIRESLTAGSAHVLIDVKPGGGAEFMQRSASGGSTSYLAGGTANAPVWVKLVRAGTTVTGYVSTNGSTWTQVGKATVSMGSSVYAGLAVCSHSTTTLNTSTFDSVTVGK